MDLFHQVVRSASDGPGFRGKWVWLKSRRLRFLR